VYKELAGTVLVVDPLGYARVGAADPEDRAILVFHGAGKEVWVGSLDVLSLLLVGGDEVGEDGEGRFRGSVHRVYICVLVDVLL
jgi:hypothetical protein